MGLAQCRECVEGPSIAPSVFLPSPVAGPAPVIVRPYSRARFGAMDADTSTPRRTMIARANAAYLLADSGKFGKPFLEMVCPWGDLAGFVVNAKLPAKLSGPASKAGVKIYIAD